MRAPRSLRRPVAALLFALSLTTSVASAAPEPRVTVTLPAGEPASRWRATLDAAGLELALHGREATIHIEAGGSRWRLVALDADGGVARELFVPAPATETDRREIAMLARALSMRLEPLNAPHAATEAPPPPPPPPAPPAKPPPMAQIESPSSAPRRAPEPAPVAPEPAPVAPEPPAGPSPEFEPEPILDLEFDPEPAPSVPVALLSLPERRRAQRRARRRARRRASLEAPPITLLGGTSLRPGAQAAAVVALDVAPVTSGRAVLGTEFSVQAARGVGRLDDEQGPARTLWRQLIDIRGLASLGVQIDPHVRVGVVGGATYRTFRQQFVPVRTSIVPVVGAQGEVATGGLVRTGVRVQVLSDLVTTRMVDATGVTTTLAPFDVNAMLFLRLQPRQRSHSKSKSKDPRPSGMLDLLDLEGVPE